MSDRLCTQTLCALAAATAIVVAAGGEATARPGCHGAFPFNRIYERVVDVKGGRVGISCSKALKVADTIVASYGDIPISSYPSDPKAAAGFQGGQDQPFRIRTSFGPYTCLMTARGSDFIVASCRQGVRTFRFYGNTHQIRPGR